MLFLKILGIVVLVVIVLYFLSIMPHMTHRADLTPFEGRYYAHRGLHNNKSEAPENSLAAYKKAVDAGYGIELDVHLSKDKIPVILHDKSLLRACGVDDIIQNYTVAELKEKFRLFGSNECIPTLAEALEVIGGKVPLIVEFKEDRFVTELCDVVAPMLDKYEGVYCMESFNPIVVRWYKKNRPHVMRGQLAEKAEKTDDKRENFLRWAAQNLMFNFLSKPDFVAYDHNCMDMLSFKLNRKLFHITTVAWTIRSQEQLEKAKKMYDLMIFDSFIPQ